MASIKKNFIYQIIYQILIIILPLFTSPYISRVLGAKNLGTYSYYYSIAYYFGIFILLGVNTYGTREIAKCNEKQEISKKFFSIYGMQLVFGIVLTCGYFIFACKSGNIVAQLQTIYVISVMLDINWFFFGIEQFKITVTRNIIIKITSVVCIFTLVKGTYALLIYTIIMAVSALLSQLILWLMLFKYVTRYIPSVRMILANVKPNFILFIPTITVSIYKIMDKIMLGYIVSKEQLAYYENADKSMSIPLGVITALGTIMMPRISKLVSKGDKSKIGEYIDYSMKFSVIAASGLAFGLMAVGEDFAPVFWGKEFGYSGQLINYLAVTVLFISWANVIRTQYLLPFNLEKVYIVSSAVGAVLNFGVNIIFIPRMGAMGAVYGTIAAEFLVAAYQTIAVWKKLPIAKYLRDNWFYFVNGIIMMLLIRNLFLSKQAGILMLCGEILFGAVYFCITSLLYMRFFDKKILKMLFKER